MNKKLLTLIILLFIIAGCSKEDKAKKAIKDHLSKTMHDYKSYEPVEFGKLDSTFSIFETTPKYIANDKIIKSIIDSVKQLHSERELIKNENELSAIRYSDWYAGSKYDKAEDKAMLDLTESSQKLLAKAKKILGQQKIDESKFKSEWDGFSLVHSFRGKNMNGATILNTEKFFLDKELSKVITSEKAEDKQ